MRPCLRPASAGVVAWALFAAFPVHADWTAKGDVGISIATGNSENQAGTANLEVKDKGDQWENTFGFAGNYGNDGNNTTAQRWELRGQTQYDFSDRAYGFGAARYEDDRFSSFEHQASVSGGLGYKLINSERTQLYVQGGPGYRFSQLQATGESQDEVILRGDAGLDHKLADTTKVVDRFLVETGSSNTYLQNDLGLEVTITGALGLRVGYQGAPQHGRPAGGQERTPSRPSGSSMRRSDRAPPMKHHRAAHPTLYG